jgi:CRP/FNR family transcriptional regulator, cyclic AMP receptor protein
VKLLLSNVPIFAGLSDRALKLFLEHSKTITVPAGDVIAREGETNDCMYLIEAGEVCILKNFNAPNPVKLAALGPGDCFGEMCVLETAPRSATGQAVGQATVVSVPSSAFFHLYRNAPEQYCIVLLNITRELSRRLRQLGDAFAARD